jgi:hypothetical protein
MQSSDSSARLFAQTQAAISDVLMQPDISVEAKSQIVQKHVEMLRAGMAVLGGIANLDLAGLLQFQ